LYCPPRSCELLDWVADCIGTLAGVGLFGIFHVIQIRRKANKDLNEQ
jgi:VanZ family protein